MVSLDLFKTNEQLAADRRAEQRLLQQQRTLQPNVAPTAAPKMEMRIGGMRMPTRTDKDTPTQKVAAAKPQIHEASRMKPGGLRMSSGDVPPARTPMAKSRYSPEDDGGLRGGRNALGDPGAMGVSSNGFGRC